METKYKNIREWNCKDFQSSSGWRRDENNDDGNQFFFSKLRFWLTAALNSIQHPQDNWKTGDQFLYIFVYFSLRLAFPRRFRHIWSTSALVRRKKRTSETLILVLIFFMLFLTITLLSHKQSLRHRLAFFPRRRRQFSPARCTGAALNYPRSGGIAFVGPSWLTDDDDGATTLNINEGMQKKKLYLKYEMCIKSQFSALCTVKVTLWYF